MDQAKNSTLFDWNHNSFSNVWALSETALTKTDGQSWCIPSYFLHMLIPFLCRFEILSPSRHRPRSTPNKFHEGRCLTIWRSTSPLFDLWPCCHFGHGENPWDSPQSKVSIITRKLNTPQIKNSSCEICFGNTCSIMELKKGSPGPTQNRLSGHGYRCLCLASDWKGESWLISKQS